ncbi:MAG TPA: PelD GGDEF domain-containing protein [Burkholderiales bacterium]|nr:PelD GGDEF domain-containing protein [Burkholderiales bacterium]
MDYRTQKELLGETRLSALFSPLLANRMLWLEAIIIPLLGLGLCWLANPEDPFFVNKGEFPWTWFAPVLVALRYGVMAGITGAAILLAGWFFLTPAGVEFPKLYFLAGVILIMVAGEYSTVWRTRLRRVGELNAYLTERFTRIMNQLNVLRLSHDALEHDLITQPATLRDALYELRMLMATRRSATSGTNLPAAQEILTLLAHHCQLEAAAMYELQDGSYVQRAKLGEPPAIRGNDSLLEYALEKRTLAHLQTEDVGTELPTEHLVIAPILTSGDQLLGVLVVTRMPFFALNEDTLRTMSLLLGLYADSVVVSDNVGQVMSHVPGVTYDFADELVKLMRLQRDYGINSHCVVLQFGPHSERVDMILFATRLRRRFDVQWQFGGGERQSTGIANLMPLASDTAVRGYLERMEGALKDRFGGDFEQLQVRPYVISLEQHDPLAVLGRIVSGEAA